MTDCSSCILIADDEPDMRQMLSDCLTHYGYTPIAAADGQEALALAASCSLALALVDIWMPGPSGMELVERLRALYPGLPVIIITAYSTVEDAVEAIRGGAFHYLEKPLSMGKLREVVEDALTTKPAQVSAPTGRPARDRAEPGGRLSARQEQVLHLIAQGMTNREIAEVLDISAKTVDHHVSALLCKLEARNRTEAVSRARESNLL